MFRRAVISLVLTSCFSLGYSQESEMSYADQLLALEQELDSLSIFNLLDSVLLLQTSLKSEMGIRFGFNSSVTSAGRDYNINQTGLSTGVSYFHKTGIYGDLTGYWNSNVTPNYNPTILSAGYLGTINKSWNFSVDYEHWFNNPKDTSSNILTNIVGASTTFNYKKINFSMDYSYLFGGSTSHRFIGTLWGNINFGKWWMFDNVSILPTASVMAGNSGITTLRITQQQLSQENINRIERIEALSELTDDQRDNLQGYIRRAFRNGNISEERRNELLNLVSFATSLTEEQLETLNQLAAEGIEQGSYVSEDAFGILNYSFIFPISFSTKRMNFMLSYTYSIPIELPGEEFKLDPLGYFGFSLFYRIPFK